MKINLEFSTSDMWRHFRLLHMTDVGKYEITPHEEKFQISPEHQSKILHICQVEKFLHIYHVFGVHFCFVFLHFALKQQFVSHILTSINLCCFGAFILFSLFLRFMVFCREIYFVAIYALLCGEKFNQKLHMWRKMTNIRYEFVLI